MAVSRSDVEALSSTGWTQLDDTRKDELLTIAQNQASAIYGGRIATLSEVEGNQEDFEKWLAAHLWELAEGGEATSESGEGGSVNYNTVTGENLDTLSETRYGRVALSYIRRNSRIGIVTT